MNFMSHLALVSPSEPVRNVPPHIDPEIVECNIKKQTGQFARILLRTTPTRLQTVEVMLPLPNPMTWFGITRAELRALYASEIQKIVDSDSPGKLSRIRVVRIDGVDEKYPQAPVEITVRADTASKTPLYAVK